MIRNFSNEEVTISKEKKSIFLAGPTRRDSPFEKSWRKEACDLLESKGFDGIVYIPEFREGSNFAYLTQVNWERKALINCSKILFYIPRHLPDMPAFTTNVEFGMYLARRTNDCIFCSPPGAEKNSYLEWLFMEEKGEDAIIHRDLDSAFDEFLKS